MRQRFRLAAVMLSGAMLLTGVPASAADTTAADDWVLCWSDEFDGTAVDETKWGFDTGNWIRDAKGNLVTGGWGNNEKEYYQKENASVADGVLTLAARKETVNDPEQGNYDYTSAKLLTKGKFSTCYGRIEVRAAMDTGASLWPAIWMLPEDEVYGDWAASGELDIMEGWGSRPSDLCGTIHFGDVWPGNTYLTNEYTLPDSTISDWHTYAVEWEPDAIRWYADDVLFSTQTKWNSVNRPFPAPFDQNFYLILNLAVGGHFDGVGDGTEVDPALFANGAEKQMRVDYVRVYHKNGEVVTPVIPAQPSMKLYLMEDGAATVQSFNDRIDATITNIGKETYSVMLAKEAFTLRAGVSYEISGSLAASMARPVLLTLEDAAYTRYLSETLSIGDPPTNFHVQITPETDVQVDFKLQLGNLGADTPTAPHTVTLSNLSIRASADGDTNEDVRRLQDYLLRRGTIDATQGDVYKDGVVDGFDLCALKQKLLFPTPAGNIVPVSDIAGLFEAMRGAKPGDVISVAPGKYDYTVYQGAQKIDTDAAGTADAPITLKAADPANPPMFTGANTEHGYVLHIKGDYWVVDGIHVTTSQKGIVLDHSNHTILQNCEIESTGSEAVALRDGSSHCIVRSCSIHDTGLITPGYGEGVYVGSAYSTTGFDYKSDYNLIEDCVFKNIAAEDIDVKEYTTGTEIRGCTFYGDGMTGQNYAGSFVDIGGNDCYVHDNVGYRNGNPNIVAAFELHEQRDGWGYGCRFANNTVYMDREYGEVNPDRRMYVVDGWFSDFTVTGDRVDYGMGLHDAIPAYYNSDTMTFFPREAT